MAATVLLLIACLSSAHAWGGLFNRFSSDMLTNLGYGRSPYRHYPYGQVDPEVVYAEALEGNRIEDADDSHCYSAACISNGDCCRGLMCLETEKYHRLVVDEAVINHFGAHLPYIDRDNLFEMRYCRPTLVASISQKLLCTHRNPLDVAYALEEVYSGIYSSRKQVQSLKLLSYTGSNKPRAQSNTLYLLHTREEKTTLSNEGVGLGEGSRILTIHEAQGLTFGSVFIINTNSKIQLHDSVPHAVVAVSRHTESCVYFTDSEDDATGRFIRRAMKATTVEYNIKMAIKDRNLAIVEALLETSAQLKKTIGRYNTVLVGTDY